MNVSCVYFDILDDKVSNFIDKLSKQISKYNINISFEMVDKNNASVTEDAIIIIPAKNKERDIEKFISEKSKILNLFAKISHTISKKNDTYVLSDFNKQIKYDYYQDKFGRTCSNTLSFGELEIERIARIGYEMAEHKDNSLISVDASDILESQKLFRKIVHDINEDYPTVSLVSTTLDEYLKVKNSSTVLTNILYGNTISNIIRDNADFETTYYTSDLGSAIYTYPYDTKSTILSITLLISDMLKNSFELYEVSDKLKDVLMSLINKTTTENFEKEILENI